MFSDLYGNLETIENISSAIAEGKLAHAYIIQGDGGSGRSSLARRTAALLAGGRKNPLAVKILEGKSPDVTEYDVPEKKKFIPVDTIRQIKYDANIKPNELDIRVFIIHNAEYMNTAGQNALLKLLEEPPKNVFFFLLCENTSALLPTVRSRAQCIRMERFSEKKIISYLTSLEKYDKELILAAAKNASGSIGRALEALDGKKKSGSAAPALDVIEALKSSDFTEVIRTVNLLAADRSELSGALTELQKALRDMICAKSGRGDMIYFNSADKAKDTAGLLSIKNMLSLADCVFDAQKDINSNMNIQTLKVCLAKRMMRALCR